MAAFFSSHKYSKIATNDPSEEDYSYDSRSNVKMGYQYTNAPYANSITRSNRSDSSGSYSSVASSDSAYEKLAPTEEELSFYDDNKELTMTSKNNRRVRFQLEKDLPALPRETSSRKPRRMSSRDGAYAWFAQRRYQNSDERLEDSMEKRTF